MSDVERQCLSTEAVHPLSAGLDTRPLEETVLLLSEEQQGAMKAIGAAFRQIVAVARSLGVKSCKSTYRGAPDVAYHDSLGRVH
ncbi:MAG: hypothetical protein KAV87_37865 [Desulfobacteraceae bacterium]|nr:hypothetical protein [Desulfobacteraceae bacterium]